MNDNQRFISLQYIKGNNYEEITCFNYDKLKIELEKIKSDDSISEKTEKLLENLNSSIEDDNCKIGESLLNDLVNYYNFREIRGLLKIALLYTQKYNEKRGYKANKEQKNSNKKLIDDLTKLKKNISKIINDNDIKNLIDPLIKPLIDYITANTLIDKTIKYTEENIKEDIKNIYIDDNTDKIKSLKQKLLSYVYTILIDINDEKLQNNKFKKIIKIDEYLNILINILEKIDKIHNNDLQKDYENIEDIIKLFKYYIRLCNTNIGKYEKIFKKNEISNIDDAFMIESYSKFLKKLNILKENLESKNEDKLKKLLINSLNKLFNLYGIDPNKTFGQSEIDYMKNYILYY